MLLTGFAPFAGEPVNPSALIAQALDGQTIGQYRVHSAILPVSFGAAPRVLRALLRRHQPQAVIALGQAGGRARIGLERVALNLIDARIPDEDGAQPIDQPVRRRAPAARFSTAPLKHLLGAALQQDWPVEISFSAGSFVCNALYFELLQQLSRKPLVPAVFIHVPWLPEQAARHSGPCMALSEQTAIIAGMIAELGRVPGDPAPLSGGREC